jgi:hypothetical protein
VVLGWVQTWPSWIVAVSYWLSFVTSRSVRTLASTTSGLGSCFVPGRPGHPRFAVLPAFFRDFEIPEESRVDDVGFGSCLFGCALANHSSHRFSFHHSELSCHLRSPFPRVEVSSCKSRSHRIISDGLISFKYSCKSWTSCRSTSGDLISFRSVCNSSMRSTSCSLLSRN